MKKLALLTLICLFMQGMVFGQILFPEVFSSFGGTAQNSTVQLTWTLGEPLYETVVNNSNVLTQGFNQIISKATDVEEVKTSDFIITAYPNPTAAILNLKIQTEKYTPLKVEVIDTQGRLLLSQTLSSTFVPLDLTGFSNGLYFLKMTEKNKVVTLIKIQKIN